LQILVHHALIQIERPAQLLFADQALRYGDADQWRLANLLPVALQLVHGGARALHSIEQFHQEESVQVTLRCVQQLRDGA